MNSTRWFALDFFERAISAVSGLSMRSGTAGDGVATRTHSLRGGMFFIFFKEKTIALFNTYYSNRQLGNFLRADVYFVIHR